MLKVIKGNLFDTSARIIAHQVNCQKVMGSGVAKQVKEKYPSVYEEYLNKDPKLGMCDLVCVDNGFYVANLYGQDKYGKDKKQYTDIEALTKAFVSLYSNAKFLGIDTIAMPYKIGCCRGGAPWSTVYMILENIFKDVDVELWKLE